jgi:uncharacterized membrane protein
MGALPLAVVMGFQGATEVLNVHPLFVHFPIALLLSSFVFYLLGAIFKNDGLLAAGKWSLYFGTLSAAVTVWTGLEAAKTAPHGGGTHDIMMVHQYIGFIVTSLSTVLSAWVFFSKANVPGKGKPVFLTVFALMCVILIQGADLGGRMVFLNGVGVGRKSMMPKVTDEHGGKEPAGQEHGGKEHAGQEHGGHDHSH